MNYAQRSLCGSWHQGSTHSASRRQTSQLNLQAEIGVKFRDRLLGQCQEGRAEVCQDRRGCLWGQGFGTPEALILKGSDFRPETYPFRDGSLALVLGTLPHNARLFPIHQRNLSDRDACRSPVTPACSALLQPPHARARQLATAVSHRLRAARSHFAGS